MRDRYSGHSLASPLRASSVSLQLALIFARPPQDLRAISKATMPDPGLQ